MTSKPSFSRLRASAAASVAAMALCAYPAAQAQTLLHSTEPKIEITALDIEADAYTLPERTRNHALSDARKVEIAGKGLLVRAILAQHAEQQDLGKSPLAQARLKQAEQRVLADMALEDLQAKQTPSDADLLKFAEAEYKANPDRFKIPAQTKASHILLVGEGEEVLEQINALYKQLQEGANFGELAFEHSQDPGSASSYGSLGYFEPGRMVPEFQAELLKLQKDGEYSAPFKSQYGWHIVQLEGRREAGTLPFAEVRERLIEEGRAAALNDLRDNLVRKTFDEAQVDEAALEAFAAKHRKLAAEGRDKP